MNISPILFKPNLSIKFAQKNSFKQYLNKKVSCDVVSFTRRCYLEPVPVEITPQRQKLLEEFAQKHGLKFSDLALLNQVFVYNDEGGLFFQHSSTYQRLEYIGDKVLDLCVTKMIADCNKNSQEGTLTKTNQKIVSNENLAKFAEKLGLGEMSYLREKEYNTKHLADMFEALLGAIFIEGKDEGFNDAYKFLKDNFSDEILNCDVEICNFEEQFKTYLENCGYDSSKVQYKYYIEPDHKISCVVEYNGKPIADYKLEKIQRTHKNSKYKALNKTFELAYERIIKEGLEILDNQ